MEQPDWSKVVSGVPELARGMVWCRTCGRSMKVNSAHCLAHGWPECCGYTMTIDAPRLTGNGAAASSQNDPAGLTGSDGTDAS